MSAARVINPSVLGELCRIRSCSPARSAIASNLSGGRRQVNNVKRDLFGQTNSLETTRHFNEELEKHNEIATKKWGFDFRAGMPIPTANSQFIWERVSCAEPTNVPQMYMLTSAAHVRSCKVISTPAQPTAYDLLMDERAERENFSLNISASSATDTEEDSCDDSQDDTMDDIPMLVATPPTATTASSVSAAAAAIFKIPTSARLRELSYHHYSKLQMNKRQAKITEYMKERKRLSQTPKKLSPPAKRMRTSSPGSSTTTSTITSSIATHFSLRNTQQQQQQQQH